MSKMIIFIHGAWLTANSWDTFRAYFEAQGYTTLAPLLLTAGTMDHTVPLSQVTANYHKYDQTAARTDFLTFGRRTHWLIKQEGWEEVASQIAAWLNNVGVGATDSLQRSAERNA